MKFSPINCAVLSVCAAASALTGCGRESVSPATPSMPMSSHWAPQMIRRDGVLSASVTIDAKSPILATVNRDVFGTNLLTSMDFTRRRGQYFYNTMLSAFRGADFGMVRMPLGSNSDFYHWDTNSFSSCVAKKWHLLSRTTFDQFMQQVAIPLALNVGITVNYGSNKTCTTGGSPSEAAAWVDHANNKMHYGVKYWTIGNEMYWGSRNIPKYCCSTPDFYVPPSAPPAEYSEIYAHLVATKFYPLMKAKDSTIKIGVDLVVPENDSNQDAKTWDQTVLSHAKYDFVEVHWYPKYSGTDSSLLTTGVAYYTSALKKLNSELRAAHKSDIPVYLAEWGPGSPNPQQVSITGALFSAMALGVVSRGGIGMAGDWEGFDSGPCYADGSSSDYTWQTWNTPSLMEAIAGGVNPACPNDPQPPLGTAFPRLDATKVVQAALQEGSKMFAPTVKSKHPILSVYAAKTSSGYGLLLVNISKEDHVTTTISIEDDPRRFDAVSLVYGKSQYDESKDNVWAVPVSKSLGAVKSSFCVTLAPWSVTAITLDSSRMEAHHNAMLLKC